MGKKDNRRIIESTFYVCSPSLISSSSSWAEEDKVKILLLLKEILKENIIEKGGSGDEIIDEIVIRCQEIVKREEEEENSWNFYDVCNQFLKYARRLGWRGRDEEVEGMVACYMEESERLKKELEEERIKTREAREREREALEQNERLIQENENYRRENMNVVTINSITQEENQELLRRIEDLTNIIDGYDHSSSSSKSITSLTKISLSFSDIKAMKNYGNIILHEGHGHWETCIIDKEMKKVC